MAGTIRKRTTKDGGARYNVLLSVKDPEHPGHWKQVTVGTFTTKAEADKALRKAATERDDGKLSTTTITFAEMATKFLEHRDDLGRGSPATLQTYRDTLRPQGRVMGALGALKLNEVTTYHIDRFVASTSDLSDNTRIAYLNLVGAIFNRAIRWGLHPGPSPTVGADRPKRPDARRVLPSDGQMQGLFDAADVDSAMMGALVRVAAVTGMRHGELAALHWGDVNFDTMELSVSRTVRANIAVSNPGVVGTVKNDKPRTFVVGTMLASVLKVWREHQEAVWADAGQGLGMDDYVFAARPYSSPRNVYQRISDRWRMVRAAAGLKLRLHDLRHFAGTQMLDAGNAPQVVASRLGHDPRMLLGTYAQTRRDADERAAESMDRLLYRDE